jgi:hypothetical protein
MCPIKGCGARAQVPPLPVIDSAVVTKSDLKRRGILLLW